ncbi:MAG: hypothetical protein ACP5O0_08750 [Acidimicrobiales bacterium]
MRYVLIKGALTPRPSPEETSVVAMAVTLSGSTRCVVADHNV